jgi:hypothetical protein
MTIPIKIKVLQKLKRELLICFWENLSMELLPRTKMTLKIILLMAAKKLNKINKILNKNLKKMWICTWVNIQIHLCTLIQVIINNSNNNNSSSPLQSLKYSYPILSQSDWIRVHQVKVLKSSSQLRNQ